MDDEEWKPCPGYEHIYSVSNHGRLRRDTPVAGSRVGRILKGMTDGHGYRTYTLRKDGVFRSEKAHRLVCWAFNGAPVAPRVYVNHRDFDRQNNTPGNLEWVTHAENIQHVHGSGRVNMENRAGDKHPKAQAVRRIAQDGSFEVFTTIKAACEATPKARRDRVWMAFAGQLQTHAGYKWEKL